MWTPHEMEEIDGTCFWVQGLGSVCTLIRMGESIIHRKKNHHLGLTCICINLGESIINKKNEYIIPQGLYVYCLKWEKV